MYGCCSRYVVRGTFFTYKLMGGTFSPPVARVFPDQLHIMCPLPNVIIGVM